DTIYLATRFTGSITMLHRRTEFRAQKVLVEELYNIAGEKKIDIKLPYVVERIVPSADGQQIDHVLIRNVDTNATEQIHADGVFVFVGMVPNTGWLKDIVPINDTGYVACDARTLRTKIPGVFVAGDCRQQASMQLATATGDGVVAAMMLKEYFRDPKSWKHNTEPGNGGGW
ncbi:MAG: hypothetical protein EHM48_09625, partial [Planctomycetaceae bacterium]